MNHILVAIMMIHVETDRILWQVRDVAVERVFVIQIKRVHCKVHPEAEEIVEH